MIPSFVVIVPAVDPDLARQCVGSMCEPIRERVLLIDNTPDGTIAAEHSGHVMFTVAHHRNRGVSHAWNEGIHFANADHSDHLLIVSQSITFGLSGGHDFLTELEARQPATIMHSQHGWKMLSLARAVWERVGMFDEWFSPAYYEEREYLTRMHHAGLPNPLMNDQRFDQINIDATSAGDALALKRGLVDINYAAMALKYAAKWGGPPGAERYVTPYGDPTLDFTFTGKPPASVAVA